MASPNKPNKDAKRCPASKSSLQAWLSTAETFCGRPPAPPLSLLIAPVMPSFAICPDEEEGAIPELDGWAGYPSAVAPWKFAGVGMGGSELAVGSAANFFNGGCCCGERLVLGLRLSEQEQWEKRKKGKENKHYVRLLCLGIAYGSTVRKREFMLMLCWPTVSPILASRLFLIYENEKNVTSMVVFFLTYQVSNQSKNDAKYINNWWLKKWHKTTKWW